jgi:TonB family protein
MRLAVAILGFVMMPLLAQSTADTVDWRGWLQKGIQAYKAGRYQDAVEALQRAVDLNPNEMNPRLYLGTAFMTLYIPGSDSPGNREFARRAEAEFEMVVRFAPNDTTALASLASLSFQEAQGMQDSEQKFRKLDESASWYEKLVAVDPQNKEANYSIGVIDWLKWYREVVKARARLGMRSEDPGPLKDPVLRRELRERYTPVIEGGISKLQRALDIDPAYDDAMAYLSLTIRYRADVADSPELYRQDIEIADQWLRKAMETKKNTARASTVPEQTLPPPSPPPPSGSPRQERIRVASNVQQNNLIHKVDPVYPPLARQARIQGTVRLVAIIGRDGSVRNLELVSGHPLMVEAARQAVMQWLYKPTILNGQPVEVVTQIDVVFALSGAELQ